MKRTKQQKGITLIALIITIVILLILAVVTINAIKGDGIVEYAKNASEEYTQGANKEQSDLNSFQALIDESLKNKWVQKGATLEKVNDDGTKTQIKIGDYVNYNEGSYTHTPDTSKGAAIYQSGETKKLTTEDLKWRVLGVNEKGELELISADPTTQKLCLHPEIGYLNAETTYNEDGSVKELGIIDTFCNDLYGQGTNSEGKKVTTNGRGLNIEDINKLTNYDPITNNNYGTKWTYKYPTDEEVKASTTGLTKNMWYKTEKPDGTLVTDWTNITGESWQTFKLPGETETISSSNPGSREVTVSYYRYDVESNLTTEDGYTSEEVTEILNMLMKGTTSEYKKQWLATTGILPHSLCASFYVFYLYNYRTSYSIQYSSYGNDTSRWWGSYVRPVVSLSEDCTFKGSGTDVGSSTNMWEIIL